MQRIEVNDLAALREMGFRPYDEGDYNTAFDYWSKSKTYKGRAPHQISLHKYFTSIVTLLKLHGTPKYNRKESITASNAKKVRI